MLLYCVKVFVIILLLASCFRSYGQGKFYPDDRWSYAIGYSNNVLFNAYELRLVSAWFKIQTQNDSWSEEEEKHPEKFKKARFCMMMSFSTINFIPGYFTPRLEYRIAHLGRATAFATGGAQFPLHFNVDARKALIATIGILGQVQLGPVSPYADVRIDTNEEFYLSGGLRISPAKTETHYKKRYHLNRRKKKE